MAFDFSLILFVLVCATGAIWAVDRALFAGARERAAKAGANDAGGDAASVAQPKEPIYVEYARAFFPVILAVFVLRSFLVEPFRIPSGSMLPSLLVGDFILVNKFSYGIRLPVINKKVVDTGSPRRGDVIVFRYPPNESINYIKRVVGLPGDRIVYDGKRVHVNGQPMEQVSDGFYSVKYEGQTLYHASRRTERLDGTDHSVLLTGPVDGGPTLSYTVPAGHYFVLGDNRDQSSDSRVWGFVPERNLVGKAFVIWFSWDYTENHPWYSPHQIKFERIGNIIR